MITKQEIDSEPMSRMDTITTWIALIFSLLCILAFIILVIWGYLYSHGIIHFTMTQVSQ